MMQNFGRIKERWLHQPAQRQAEQPALIMRLFVDQHINGVTRADIGQSRAQPDMSGQGQLFIIK